jgi:DNA-binding transcriptional regulator GbsR (MarR family)
MERFVLHWGEMGARWGVNRTVAQIHALLYLSETPLDAEQIQETLSVARSNVSTSLRELQNWGIVRVVHVMGDRRDRFESIKDVWELFRIILDERKRREFDPTIQVLRDCLGELKEGDGADDHARPQIQAMLEFFESVSSLYDQMQKLPAQSAIKLARLGPKIRKLLEIRGR